MFAWGESARLRRIFNLRREIIKGALPRTLRTKDEDYLENSTKQAEVCDYEKEIDQLVYKLYNLTPEEIEIVEGRR